MLFERQTGSTYLYEGISRSKLAVGAVCESMDELVVSSIFL